MRLEIVHLSDIHFRNAGNPIAKFVDQLIQAVNSVDPSPSLILVAISGDIAFSGKTTEYDVALKFFKEFAEKLKILCPETVIRFVSVPGNHDCALPKTGIKLRDALIQAVIPSMQESKQDKALLQQLQKSQSPYNRFRKKLNNGENWDGICETLIIEHKDKKIQINLYNTALLSRLEETQGKLYLPIRAFQDHVLLVKDSYLSISIFHHSYLWLEANTAVIFRNHIESTSDIALTGHQHYGHRFYKDNSTGERVLYLEAPALQDEKFAKTSSFYVLLIDSDSNQERTVQFRRSKEMYRTVDDTDWRPLTINRNVRTEFRLNSKFEAELNMTKLPIFHRTGNLGLRDIFIFPNALIRAANTKRQLREVKGDDLLLYVLRTRRIIFQGISMSGKSALASILFWEIFRRNNGNIPILLNGHSITAYSEDKVLASIWTAFGHQYDRSMLEDFKQLNKTNRVILIDDWHKAALNVEGRRQFLSHISKYFDKIMLFTDELFQIHEVISNSADLILEFDHASIMEFGHGLTGRMIDKWVSLGREYTGDARKLRREIEAKERTIRSVMGKKTLPALPFIVLSLLEADEEEKAEGAEGFPLTDIKELHKKFSDNPFADTILADLVRNRIMVLEVDRRLRQSMASLFRMKRAETIVVAPQKPK